MRLHLELGPNHPQRSLSAPLGPSRAGGAGSCAQDFFTMVLPCDLLAVHRALQRLLGPRLRAIFQNGGAQDRVLLQSCECFHHAVTSVSLVFHLVCTPWQTRHTSSATLDVLSRGWLAKSEEILFLIDAQIQQAFLAKTTISCTCYSAYGKTLIFSRANHCNKRWPLGGAPSIPGCHFGWDARITITWSWLLV